VVVCGEVDAVEVLEHPPRLFQFGFPPEHRGEPGGLVGVEVVVAHRACQVVCVR
jgi:hypothetical protein